MSSKFPVQRSYERFWESQVAGWVFDEEESEKGIDEEEDQGLKCEAICNFIEGKKLRNWSL